MAAVCITAVMAYIRRMQYFKPLQKLPGTPPTFLIGNISWVVGLYARSKKLKFHPGVYIYERIIGAPILHQNSGMYVFWFGLQPLVSVFQGEIAELVLSSSVSIEKSFEYRFLQKWLGTGLLTSKAEKWRFRRKLLTPSFHFRILEDFMPVFNQQSLQLVNKLKSQPDKDYIDIAPLVVLCTLDVICETVMGVSIGAQKGKNLEYVEAIHNLADFFNQRACRPWLWTDFLFGLTSLGRHFNRDIDILHNFTDKVIKEKKEKLLASSKDIEMSNEGEFRTKKRKTFMDILLDMHVNGQQLSEADIREEVDTFMFEGHDTTAMGIIFALYCIGLYPEVQRKVTEELDEIFAEDINRPVTYDDTRNMKYLECVLKESQRLYPSVPIIGRKLSEDIDFDGFRIPKNTTIHLNLLGLHRNTKTFPNPEKFDPERFLPDNSFKRHPYAYVPFSAGPRNCIGQKFAMLEEKTIVSNIIRHFKISSIDPRDMFHVKVEFTLRPAQEVRMRFSPRY